MTDQPSQPAVDPALVARVKGILLQPRLEWERIDGEFATTQTLFTRYAMILAAIGPICSLLGGLLFKHTPIVGALVSALINYGLALLGVYVLGLIINALAPSFGSVPSKIQAMKVAVYSWTAAWLVGVFGLIPPLGLLVILGLYTFYLLFVGLPILMKTPEDKKVGYFVVVLIVALVVFMIIGAVVSGVTWALVGASAAMSGLSTL